MFDRDTVIFPTRGFRLTITAMLPHFFDLSRDDLRQRCADWGLPVFRATQVLEWVYRHGIIDPAAMTNLSARDRQTLAENLAFTSGSIAADQRASDGTRKLLLTWDQRVLRVGNASPAALPQLNDAASQTECVMIPADDGEKSRRTACVSSQVGCPVGCRFCASGLGGLDANLTAGQIVEQVWHLSHNAAASAVRAVGRKPPDELACALDDSLGTSPGTGGLRPTALTNQGTEGLRPAAPTNQQGTARSTIHRISHVVFMGMGEPLANFDNVIRAIGTLMAEWALGISGRRITVSTVGLPAQIRRLADADLPVTLAISLHAPNDALRQQIIPWAQRVSIQQLLDAGRHYFDHTGREVTLEYILLSEVNDQPAHARELAAIARTLRSNVNLIRYNEVSPLPFKRPGDEAVTRFLNILRRAGVNTHLRASRGRDIAAACGQLRHERKS